MLPFLVTPGHVPKSWVFHPPKQDCVGVYRGMEKHMETTISSTDLGQKSPGVLLHLPSHPIYPIPMTQALGRYITKH